MAKPARLQARLTAAMEATQAMVKELKEQLDRIEAKVDAMTAKPATTRKK